MNLHDAIEQAYINGFNEGLERAAEMFLKRADSLEGYPLMRPHVVRIFKEIAEAKDE